MGGTFRLRIGCVLIFSPVGNRFKLGSSYDGQRSCENYGSSPGCKDFDLYGYRRHHTQGANFAAGLTKQIKEWKKHTRSQITDCSEAELQNPAGVEDAKEGETGAEHVARKMKEKSHEE